MYFERSKEFDYQSLYMLAVMLYDGTGCKPDTVMIFSFIYLITLFWLPLYSYKLHALHKSIKRVGHGDHIKVK